MKSEFLNRIKFFTSLLIAIFQLMPLLAQEQITTLTGSVKNPITDELTIKFFQDNITYEELNYGLALSKNNNFATRLNIAEPLSASLIYRNIRFPILLFPGDSVNISFDALNPAQNIVFSGKGTIQNQWFFESSLEFREYEEQVINENMIKRNPLDFYNYLDRVLTRKKQFLSRWLNGRQIDPAVKNYIESDINYWFVYQLYRYPSFHRAVNGNSGGLLLPGEFYRALSNIMLNNPEMLGNENYVNFLDKLKQFWIEEPDQHNFIYKELKEVYLNDASLMLSDYEKGPVIGQFEKGTPFLPTGKMSEQSDEIQIGDSLITGYWIQVKASSGLNGWLHDYAVKKLPDDNENLESFYNLFIGETRSYLLAKSCYWNELIENDSLINLIRIGDARDRFYKLIGNADSLPIQSTPLIVLNAAETAKVFGETFFETSDKITAPIIRKTSENPLRNYTLPQIDSKLDPVDSKLFRISGRIAGIQEKEIALTWVTDPVSQKDEKRFIRLGSSGDYSLEIDLAQTIFGTLTIGRDQLILMMRPGASLQVNLLGPDLSRTNFSGSGAAAASFLLAKDNYLMSINPVYNRMIKELDGEGFKNYLLTHKKELIGILGATSNISFKDLTLLEADINFWYGNELMNFPWEKPFRLGIDAPLVMPDSYYGFIEEISLEQDESLGNPAYISYLEQVLSHWNNTLGFTKIELANQNLTGKTAWWVKASSIAAPMRMGDMAAVVDDVQFFLEDCPYPEYRNEIRTLYNANKGLGTGDPAPPFQLSDRNGKPVTLEDLRGKVVYLDFWATWCTPCLTQMRNSTQWKKQFDERPVEFVYVSLDRNQSDWQRYLAKQQISGIHLHAGNSQVFLSEIAQLYKVKKLPAIFIINQDGEIEYSSGDPSILNASAEIIQSLL